LRKSAKFPGGYHQPISIFYVNLRRGRGTLWEFPETKHSFGTEAVIAFRLRGAKLFVFIMTAH